MKSKEIISDPIYEQAVEASLQQARGLLQNLLDVWNASGLEKLEGTVALYELVHNPATPFTEAVDKLKQIPVGLTEKQVEKFMAELVIPMDTKILTTAEKCQKNPYTQRELSLFQLNNGSVELAPKCQEMIKKQSVFVQNESQLKFYNELKALVDELNRLDLLSGGKLLMENHRTLSPVFSNPDRDQAGGKVGISSEGLRDLLNNII